MLRNSIKVRICVIIIHNFIDNVKLVFTLFVETKIEEIKYSKNF